MIKSAVIEITSTCGDCMESTTHKHTVTKDTRFVNFTCSCGLGWKVDVTRDVMKIFEPELFEQIYG